MPNIELIQGDCMEYMSSNICQLALCDIPYGIGVGKMAYLKEKNTTVKQKNGTRLNPNKNKPNYQNKDWDNKLPSQDYFDLLLKTSQHQIIFGSDYTNWNGLGKGRIKWDKGFSEGVSFNRYEVAYCSFIDETITIPYLWAGMQQAKSIDEPMVQQGNKKLNEKRIHPTQKPVGLYKTLLNLAVYAGALDKLDIIRDDYGGSRSLAIACYDLGFDHVSIELDKDYHRESKQRFDAHVAKYAPASEISVTMKGEIKLF